MIKFFLLLLLISNFASAGNVQGAGLVKNIYFHSKDTVIALSWKGMLQLEVESLAWNTDTTCSTKYVAVREKDTHLVSAILAAKLANVPITVYANDELKATGSYCFVRAIGV